MKSRWDRISLLAGLFRVLLVVSLIIVVDCACERNPEPGKKSRVLVLHSYEPEFEAYPNFNLRVAQDFRRKGIRADIKTLYLNCEQYQEAEEIVRAYDLLDSVGQDWRPDIILINEDQATYSFLKSKHPFINEIPVVFSGVNYPNMSLIRSFPNVTGFLDKPDFVENCKLIEKTVGKSRILFFHDRTFFGRSVMEEFAVQLPGSNFVLREDWVYNWLKDPGMDWDTLGRRNDEEFRFRRPSTTSIWATPIRESKASALLWVMSGMLRYCAFLQVKRDYTTMRIGNMAGAPCFTVINDGFGYGLGLLGGYMTTLETQVDEQVGVAAEILRGKSVTSVPIQSSKKEYVFDWSEMKRWKIGKDQLPVGCTIVNMPLWERYKAVFILLIMGCFISVVVLIAYLIFLYHRERMRKQRAQDDLVKEKEFLSLALEKGDVYAWRYDIEQQKFFFERDFFKFIGITSQDFKIEDFLRIIHPDDWKSAQQVFASVLNGVQKTGVLQVRARFGENDFQWWEYRISSINKQEEREGILIGLCLNVQGYKDKEDELILARDLAAKAELKQSFLANMSHEIRTPLNAIVGFSNLLVNDNELEEEEKVEYSGIINTNCDLLLKLVNDVLVLSRLESGHMSFTMADCDLNDMMEEVFATHQRMMPEGITLLKEIPTGSVTIRTDRLRLHQVITNFINNAVKFTPKGHILIGYAHRAEEGSVSIFVEDSGIGIPEEVQKVIFNRFYKHDEFAQGTGLGLAICGVIVERLGGRIDLKSEKDQGSRFTVVIKY